MEDNLALLSLAALQSEWAKKVDCTPHEEQSWLSLLVLLLLLLLLLMLVLLLLRVLLLLLLLLMLLLLLLQVHGRGVWAARRAWSV